MDANELIKVGKAFVRELEIIKEHNHSSDLSRIQGVLDKLKLDEGWHLGLRFAEDKGFGDKSWFYCFQGKNDTYCEDYRRLKVSNDDMDDFWKCYDQNPIFDIFQHLHAPKSELAFWQAYLLSKATYQLPTWWHGGYGRKQFIFSKEDKIKGFFVRIDSSEIQRIRDNLIPYVNIKNDIATVSCCFFGAWRGLYRHTVQMKIVNGRVLFLEGSDSKILYKYNCGIKF